MPGFNSMFVVPAAVAVMGICTVSAVARPQEPARPSDAERAASPRSSADPRPRCAPEGTILGCAEAPPTIRRRTEADRKVARVVARGPKPAKQSRRARPARAPMQNGFEPEPIVEIELRREILVFLAAVTGERSLRRAGAQLPRLSTIRALAEVDSLERARRRATYIETEDFKGNERSIITSAAIVAGGVLLASGAAIERAVDAEPGDRIGAEIKPQLWPPGIRIKGSFDWP